MIPTYFVSESDTLRMFGAFSTWREAQVFMQRSGITGTVFKIMVEVMG